MQCVVAKEILLRNVYPNELTIISGGGDPLVAFGFGAPGAALLYLGLCYEEAGWTQFASPYFIVGGLALLSASAWMLGSE